MARRELDSIDRGSKAPDLAAVIEAARLAALARTARFSSATNRPASPGSASRLLARADLDRQRLRTVSRRVVRGSRRCGLRASTVRLASRSALAATRMSSRPPNAAATPSRQLRLITGGPLVWAPAVDGSIVLSLRGGDFELVLGEDFSIGYASHDADSVVLYLEESMTFRNHTPEAAVALTHPA